MVWEVHRLNVSFFAGRMSQWGGGGAGIDPLTVRYINFSSVVYILMCPG